MKFSQTLQAKIEEQLNRTDVETPNDILKYLDFEVSEMLWAIEAESFTGFAHHKRLYDDAVKLLNEALAEAGFHQMLNR